MATKRVARKTAKRKAGKSKIVIRKKVKHPSPSGGGQAVNRKCPQKRKITEYGIIPVVNEDEDNES